MPGQQDFLSQAEMDALLKSVTGETDDPQSDEFVENWAAALAGVTGVVDTELLKPRSWIQLIDKLQHEIEKDNRAVEVILARRNATYTILQDILCVVSDR